MGQDVILMGSTFPNVPSITLPKVNGGVATFIDPTAGLGNYIHGEFTTNSTSGVQTVTIPYRGTGYPIMIYICIKGGAYVPETEWYTVIKRYSVGVWAMTKTEMSSAPTYTTSGIENQGVTMGIFKNSTTDAATFSRSSAMTTNVYSSSNPTAALNTVVRFKGDGTTLAVFVAASSYGLLPEQDYEYFVVYST